MPRKAKHSQKRRSRGISNLVAHTSSQGHSTSVEAPLQHSELAQPCAPTTTLNPSSIPGAQNLVSSPDPQLHTMPHKGKRSNKRTRHGTSNLMSLALSQGHSAPVEPSLVQPCAPTITVIPPSVPTAQNIVSTSDPPSLTMSRKAKYSNKRICRGISNLVPRASSQAHSTLVEPPLKPSKAAQPRAPSITIIPPSIPRAQNLVSPSDAPLLMPRKAKLSRERASLGISNFMPHASSSQGHSTHVEPPKSFAPAYSTAIPSSIPTTQNPVSASDLPLHTKPHKAKLSRERASLGVLNLMPYASAHGHSTHVEPSLQVAQSCVPTVILVPPSIASAQNLVSASDPALHKMPRKAKHSKKRGLHVISNWVPHASSQGHSTHVEPPLQPSLAPESWGRANSTAIPPSIPTSQNLVSASVPSLHTMPRKAKLSRERASLGISNLMPYASSYRDSTHVEPPLSRAPTITLVPPPIATTQNLVSPSDPPLHTMPCKAKYSKKRRRGSYDISNLIPQGHSTHVEPQPPLQHSELAQSHAPTISHIPSPIPTALDPLSLSEPPSHLVPPNNAFSGILDLIRHASFQGYTIHVESPQHSPELEQPCAPTITDIPPSIPTAQDLVSLSNIPSCSMPRKSKRSKKRVSHGISNLMPHASSQGHSIPIEVPLLPSELAQPCAPPVVLVPTSPVAQDPVSPSDPSSIPVNQDPVSPSDPSSIPVTQDLVSPSDPSSRPVTQDQVSPSTLTQQPLAPNYHRFRGRQWAVQAIDQHGNTIEIQVTKPDVFLMPPGQRIIVPFDGQLRAYGEAAALLSGACGRIVTDSKNIPINFDSWSKVPKSYKDNCFNILKTLFHFQASESIARRYCVLTMSRKYRNGKLKLWVSAFDPSLSREQLIAKVPYGIPEDQWLSFIDNHLKPEYQELCRKNAEVRQRQTIPHTSGAKLLSRKQHEMEVELGRPIDRVELYIATHKKKDGSYVNAEARSIGEKLTEEIGKCANSAELSTNDALAKVLGRDHSGRVRCLGLGGLHSVAFQSTKKFSGIGCSLLASDSVESSQLKEEVISLKTKLAASEENVKTLQNIMLAYIQMKEGHIPAEFGALINTTNQTDESSGEYTSTSESGSSLASNRH